MALISVIVPTIKGREHWLERCEAAYRATTEDFEFIVLNDYPTCGAAWNEGLQQAKGDYINLSADDLEPQTDWWVYGILAVDAGIIPCPRILNPDGTLQSCGTFAEEAEDGTPSVVARVPFFSREMAEVFYPIFENHYMGDHWITWKGNQHGWPTLVVRKMVFTHHFAMEGRIDTLTSDVKAYHRATR